MVGGKELKRLRLHKQALILESDLNRIALRTEYQNLRSAAARATDMTGAWRTIRPWLPILAPAVGYLAVRAVRRSESVLGGLVSVAKWIQPLYLLWRSVASRQKEADTPTLTAS